MKIQYIVLYKKIYYYIYIDNFLLYLYQKNLNKIEKW